MIFGMYQTSQIELSSGVHTYCDIGNAGRTMLLLHGFSFRQGMYPLAETLVPDFRVVIPDLPFATKHNFHMTHTLENYTDSLLEFVKRLELENVSIFGNSVGATLGLMCCVNDSSLFDKLIIRCPLWSGKQLPECLQIEPLITLHAYFSKNKFLAQKMLSLFYHLSVRMSPVEGDQTRKNASKNLIPYRNDQIDPVVLSKFLGHFVQVEIEEQLTSVSNETLIFWGEQDAFIQSEWGAKLDQLLPSSHFIEAPGEYHNIATVKPKILANAISEFVVSREDSDRLGHHSSRG